MGTRMTKKDAIQGCYKNDFTVFVPKLKPQQVKPVCMLHIKNGAGSCLCRFESPDRLANFLRDLANRISTTEWIDKWQVMEDISEDFISTGRILLDETFMDVDDFKEAWINEGYNIDDAIEVATQSKKD